MRRRMEREQAAQAAGGAAAAAAATGGIGAAPGTRAIQFVSSGTSAPANPDEIELGDDEDEDEEDDPEADEYGAGDEGPQPDDRVRVQQQQVPDAVFGAALEQARAEREGEPG